MDHNCIRIYTFSFKHKIQVFKIDFWVCWHECGSFKRNDFFGLHWRCSDTQLRQDSSRSSFSASYPWLPDFSLCSYRKRWTGIFRTRSKKPNISETALTTTGPDRDQCYKDFFVITNCILKWFGLHDLMQLMSSSVAANGHYCRQICTY